MPSTIHAKSFQLRAVNNPVATQILSNLIAESAR